MDVMKEKLGLTKEEQTALFQCLIQINEIDYSISISPKDNRIKIYGKSGYIYKIEKQNNKYVLVSKYKKQNHPKRNAKTKKGFIKGFKKSVVPISMITLLIIAAIGATNKYAKTKENHQSIEILEQSDEYLKTINPTEISISIENNEIVNEKMNDKLTDTIYSQIRIDTEIIQSSRIHKRQETDELYHDVITSCSKRWGLPKELISALITQERDELSLNNPGQLTRNICGEKIILPIIEKSETDIKNNKDTDKIYVIREEPKRENYKSEKNYLEQLEIYKNQLEMGKRLKQEGFQIISFSDLLGEDNAKENIRIASAYITYCNYKLNSPILGTYAYNAGYTTAKNTKLEDILNGVSGSEYADKDYIQHVYRFLYSQEATNLQFISKTLPENWNELTPSEQEKFLSEKNSNMSLTITALSLPQFKEYQYAEEVGSNLRR